jgi:hypothetical protein
MSPIAKTDLSMRAYAPIREVCISQPKESNWPASHFRVFRVRSCAPAIL